jgi:hypothetical protein
MRRSRRARFFELEAAASKSPRSLSNLLIRKAYRVRR